MITKPNSQYVECYSDSSSIKGGGGVKGPVNKDKGSPIGNNETY